jgi:succinate dehydrogenase/fumarate reductase cytochrome b subunit
VRHLTDDELVLHYYGEDGARLVAAEHHLRSCAQCAGAYESLTRMLRAVTPPALVEAPDDLPALRALLHDRSRRLAVPPDRHRWALPGEAGATALVWLAALLYPFSFQALFDSARVAQDHSAGILLVALTLTWTCAGPFVAVFALNRMTAAGFGRASTRGLVLGALMAAISPSMNLLVSRADASLSLNLGVWSWFGALALASFAVAFRWPSGSYSTVRFLYVHRLSALVLTVFVLAHVVNQALAFVSVPSYTAMRNVMRVASRDPLLYTVIVGAVATQTATGAAMGLRRVRPRAIARNLQAVTGWYLAAFLLTHVFSGFLFSAPPQGAAAVAPAASQFNMLANLRGTAQLPYLLLGVATFLFHVGIYARLAALAWLAEASVRRLSYAAMFVGTTVVVTVGLALCGIHLIR